MLYRGTWHRERERRGGGVRRAEEVKRHRGKVCMMVRERDGE